MSESAIELIIRFDTRPCALSINKINFKLEKNIFKKIILIYKIIKLKISLFIKPKDK